MSFLIAILWPSATVAISVLAYRAHARHLERTRAYTDETLAKRVEQLEQWREVIKNRPGLLPK